MTRPEEPQWGIPFDTSALEAAVSLAADLGLPLNLAHEHEGCPEVLEVSPRDYRAGADVQFMIWCATDGTGFIVQDMGTEGFPTMTFGDLNDAVRFCRKQRGDDWPMRSHIARG